MEALIILMVALIVLLVGAVIIGAVMGFVAVAKIAGLRRELEQMRADVRSVERQVSAVGPQLGAPPRTPVVEPKPPPVVVATAIPAPPPKAGEEEVIPDISLLVDEPVVEVAAPPAPPPRPPVSAEPVPIPEPEEPAWQKRLRAALSGGDEAATFEEIIGKRWMTWAGGLALFVAVAFFVKYAIDKEWIGPTARVVAGVVFGLALLVAGDAFIRRQMRALGLGLIGAAGLPILYVSLFAAFQFYHLVPQPVAFGAMVVVTAGGMFLACRHDSLVVSFLAVLGGFLTPVLLSTGTDSRDALFGYLLVLDLGVLAVAFLRKWRALDVLAFIGTGALYAGWFAKFYAPAALVPALAWLGVFYAVFLLMPFGHHLRHRTHAPVERFLVALSVAAGVFGYAHWMLFAKHKPALGFVALAMGACYAALGILSRRRTPGDARSPFAFLALAMLFAIISVPLHFGLNGITLVWAAQGVVLVALGYRFRYWPARLGGLAALALAVIRVLARHWPTYDEPFRLLLNTQFGVAVCVCLATAAFAGVHHWWRERGSRLDTVVKVACALAAGVLALIMLHAEFDSWFGFEARRMGASARYLSDAAGIALWALGALPFLAAGLWLRSQASRLTAVAALGVSALVALLLYGGTMPTGWHAFANLRFAATLLAVAAGFAHALALCRFRERCEAAERTVAETLFVVAGACLLLALSFDLDHLVRTKYEARCAVAVLWALGAAAFVASGLRWPSLPRRVAGLVVLAGAFVLATLLFEPYLVKKFTLYVNYRFLTCLLPVLATFGVGWALRRWRRACTDGEQYVAAVALWAGGVLLLVLLSLEAYLYAKSIATSAQRARWSAQMAISITWSVFAVAVLAIGFWKRVRAMRLVALGLFGVTALKLVIVDIAHIEQIYRILSFLVLGVLMIGASYLYHRVEKRLQAIWRAEEE